MNWYKKLFAGESLGRSRSYYRFLIEHTKRPVGTYSILLPAARDRLLEICRSEQTRDKHCCKDDQLIVGLAGTKAEAYELAGRIVLHVLNETGGTDLKAFFAEQENRK